MQTVTSTIEITVPDGYEPVAYRIPQFGERYSSGCGTFVSSVPTSSPFLIVREKQKAARPYNAAEMESLVGKVLRYDCGGVHLVTDFNPGQDATVRICGEWEIAEDLQLKYNHLDGTRCEVVE